MRRYTLCCPAAPPRPGLLGLVAVWLVACATSRPSPPSPSPAAPITHYEMEPLRIEAVRGSSGIELEAFDAAELFERAGAALSGGRYEDALRVYDRLLAAFPESRYALPALYNAGLAQQGKKDWAGAVSRFQALADRHAGSAEAKDALFQLGASFAELGNWPASAEVFARVLDRQDLTADDRIEGYARRGFAQFNLRDLDTSERTFRAALSYRRQIETEERLQTDFYLGLCHYHLGQIPHERFRGIPLRLPERQMSQDMDDKARLLLHAQRQYIETIKLGNPQWASASGFQIGSLYQEFYDAFMNAPIPPELGAPGKREARDLYLHELRKRIRVLLEKAVRVHEQNLLMLERVGLQNEWREKSTLAYSKLQNLLDPMAPLGPPSPGTTGVGPPLPAGPVPPRSQPTPAPSPALPPADRRPDAIPEPDRKERVPQAPLRQIL